MLVEFRVGNYRSFHEEQVLSLVASNDPQHPDNLIAAGKPNLLKGVGLYGANASGKSNLIKAIDFMKSFVAKSATEMTVGDKIDVVPFRLSREAAQRPSSFEVTLLREGIRYRYGFTVTEDRVCDEWLIAYPKARAQRWFERHLDPDTEETRWAFRGVLRRHGELLRERTRNNGLVLSRAAELNVDAVIPLFQWFDEGLEVLDLSALLPAIMAVSAAAFFATDVDLRRRAVHLLRDADLGITDLRIDETLAGDFRRTELALAAVAIALGHEYKTSSDQAATNRVQTVHRAAHRESHELFSFIDAESKGTQRYFGLLSIWLQALRHGGVIVVDELDSSMHPVLTRKLIQFFQAAQENTSGAQLVFAAHDTTLMDQSLFRRDQIWLVEKDASQASRLFSLYDFKDKPRKGEALEKRYLAGRYGGVPVFGPSFEDLGVD